MAAAVTARRRPPLPRSCSARVAAATSWLLWGRSCSPGSSVCPAWAALLGSVASVTRNGVVGRRRGLSPRPPRMPPRIPGLAARPSPGPPPAPAHAPPCPCRVGPGLSGSFPLSHQVSIDCPFIGLRFHQVLAAFSSGFLGSTQHGDGAFMTSGSFPGALASPSQAGCIV